MKNAYQLVVYEDKTNEYNTLIIIYICNKHVEPVIILPARNEEEDPELPEEG